MDDDMIKALAENGGVIQINFGSTFIDGEVQKAYDSIRAHIVNWLTENNLDEEDSVAQEYIKTYMAENFPYSTVEKVADHIDHVVQLVGIDYVGFGSDYDGVGDTLPTGLKDVSEYPNLIAELLRRGYSREDIEKICYKNVFRVWEAVENTAQKLSQGV
jgi:membrane dipeptidase